MVQYAQGLASYTALPSFHSCITGNQEFCIMNIAPSHAAGECIVKKNKIGHERHTLPGATGSVQLCKRVYRRIKFLPLGLTLQFRILISPVLNPVET